jgi:hypothetical protein
MTCPAKHARARKLAPGWQWCPDCGAKRLVFEGKTGRWCSPGRRRRTVDRAARERAKRQLQLF